MRTSLALFVVAACGTESSEPGRIFDPCAPTVIAAPHATASELGSLEAAIDMWRVHGATGLVRGDAPQLALEFRDAAASIYGYYDDTSATVYINTRLDDPAARAIAIAHELGHALALIHIDESTRVSVMNPGNLTNAPNPADRAALAELWGACAP